MPKFLDLIQYADKNGDIKTIDLSVNSIKGTTPIRDELGLFKVGNESTSPQNPLDAVNKKYVDEKIASSVASGESDFNLKNGGGQGSLVQTHVISSSGTPYNNIASGPASISLGKNTKAQGNTDFVIGQNNTDNSSGSFVGGSNCENTGNYAFVFGRYLNNTQIGAVRLGSYNKDNDYTAFSIGIGDVDHRENGLEYDAYTNTLSVPTGNILYGTNLQGNNANFSGEVKIGKHFIGELGGPFVFKVGSYFKTSNVSGFEVDRDGDTTFFGKLKSGRTPTEDTDVVRKLELDEVAVKVLTQSQVDSLF